jgi:hypothetical protein
VIEVAVEAGHDEADDALKNDAEGKRVPGANPVGNKSTQGRSWDVEQVDHRAPAESFPERGVSREQESEPRARVDAEGVRGEIVDEPDQADDGETEAVKFDDE